VLPNPRVIDNAPQEKLQVDNDELALFEKHCLETKEKLKKVG
jgi:hypothetical protein